MAQIFPRWTNEVPKLAPPIIGLGLVFVVFVVWYWFSPKHLNVGYAPEQPVPYSHKLHAGQLGWIVVIATITWSGQRTQVSRRRKHV